MELHDVDTVQMLALLAQAQRLLRSDPAQAHHVLDHACGLLRQAGRDGTAKAPLVPQRVPSSPSASATGGLAGWQLRNVTAHIDARLDRPLATTELALVARLSPGHFCRAFKVSMGETPHAYVIRQRIRRAQMLMLDTCDSLSDIAGVCGLTDQAHLTRLFKRMVGTTPLLWRRASQRPGPY